MESAELFVLEDEVAEQDESLPIEEEHSTYEEEQSVDEQPAEDKELADITQEFLRQRDAAASQPEYNASSVVGSSSRPKDKRVSIPIRFSPDLYKQFKIALIQDGLTAQKAIERLVQNYVYEVARRVPPVESPKEPAQPLEQNQTDYSGFRSRSLD